MPSHKINLKDLEYNHNFCSIDLDIMPVVIRILKIGKSRVRSTGSELSNKS